MNFKPNDKIEYCNPCMRWNDHLVKENMNIKSPFTIHSIIFTAGLELFLKKDLV